MAEIGIEYFNCDNCFRLVPINQSPSTNLGGRILCPKCRHEEKLEDIEEEEYIEEEEE